VSSGVHGFAIGLTALLLRAKRQSEKRAHRECCTQIAHLIPPELNQSKTVWFTLPPADRALLPADPVKRISIVSLVAALSPDSLLHPTLMSERIENLKKEAAL